jgi:hypothetical protein
MELPAAVPIKKHNFITEPGSDQIVKTEPNDSKKFYTKKEIGAILEESHGLIKGVSTLDLNFDKLEMVVPYTTA